VHNDIKPDNITLG
jgi:serine/threonine protein kinase